MAQKSNRKINWDNEKFTVGILSNDEKIACWGLSQEGNFDLPVITDFPLDKAESVIEVFSKLSEEKKSFGIFIYSKSFAIPNTPEERQYMGKYLWERYNDEQWRESESKLINDLRFLCNSKGIALYVNLSANLQGEWKKIAPSSNLNSQ